MKSYKLLLSVALTAMLPAMLQARQLTPGEALDRARAEMPAKAPGAQAARFDAAAPAFTGSFDGIARVYALNRVDRPGYVLLAADDCVAPVLGYSDEGVFVADNMPDNLRWWLDEYARQIAYAASHPAKGERAHAPAQQRANIAPLLKSKWNQDSPYNNLCPVATNGTRTVTGCVATAMAQVMYYHKWPTQGIGSHSYTPSTSSALQSQYATLSANFGATTYNWGAMTDTYSSSSTAEANNAVATLMYHCGVSVDMGYNVSAAGGSGAVSAKLPVALVNYFGYDPGALYVQRDYHTSDVWEEMLYAELLAFRPVLYGGGTADGAGHQFVCDGYADGLYHINWGWGGMSDGYFVLAVLDPGTQGIGGADAGFSYDQDMVVGVKPLPQGATQSEYSAVYMTADSFAPAATSYSRNTSVKFTATNCANGTALTMNISAFGVKVTDANGNDKYYQSNYSISLSPYSYFPNLSYNISLRDVPVGTYTVTPVVKTRDDVWHDIHINASQPQEQYMTVTSSNITFVAAEVPAAQITYGDVTMDTPLYVDRAFKFSTTVTSDIDTDIAIQPVVYIDDSWYTINSPIILHLTAHTPAPVEFVGALDAFSAGSTYKFGFADAEGYIRSYTTATAQADPGAPVYANASLAIMDPISVNGIYSLVPANKIHLKGGADITAGYLTGAFGVYIFPASGGYSLAAYGTPVKFVEAGNRAEFDMEISFTAGEVGKSYFMLLEGGDERLSNYVYFTLAEPEVEPGAITFINEEFSASTPQNFVAKDNTGVWRANSIVLSDAYPYAVPYDVQCGTLTYSRNVLQDKLSALYLPFDVEYAEWSEFADRVLEFVGTETTDGGGTALVFRRLDVGETVYANTPYLMVASSETMSVALTDATLRGTPAHDPSVAPTGSKFVLHGNYRNLNGLVDMTAYALAGGVFHPAANNSVVLKPYRVYITPNLMGSTYAEQALAVVEDNGTTYIEAIDAAVTEGADLYDLQGRKVINPTSGIYIINGQKIIIK